MTRWSWWGTSSRRRVRRGLALSVQRGRALTRLKPRRLAGRVYFALKPGLAVLLGVAVVLGVLELALRIPGPQIPRSLDTALFSCYDGVDPDQRVQFWSPELGIDLLKPDFTARCGSNGHHWTHATDAHGFRNPETWDQVDVVLLGDAPIYGDGLEESQTLAHHLRAKLNVRVANLALSGDGPTEYMALARNFAAGLHPKLAFVFLSADDLDDVVRTHSMDEMRAFVEQDHELALGLYPEQQLLSRARDGQRAISGGVERYWFTYRAVRFLMHRHDPSRAPVARPIPTTTYPEPLPAGVPPFDAKQAEAVLYTRKAMRYAKLALDGVGAQLVLVTLPGLYDRDTDWRVDYTARKCARDLGVPQLSAREALATPHARRADDGQPSELGEELLAELLESKLRENHWL